MKRISFYAILLLFIFCACTESKFKNDENSLNELINVQEIAKKKKCILVIPMNGCGVCTQEIINFSEENYANKKISIILTGLTSQNILSIKKLKNYQNYFTFDEYSALISQGVLENKPIVFFIKGEKIDEKIIFDDNNVKDVIKRIIRL